MFKPWSKAVGMRSKVRAVGNAQALSTGRAGARQRIVHMSTAWGAASVQCALPPSPARQGLSSQAFR